MRSARVPSAAKQQNETSAVTVLKDSPSNILSVGSRTSSAAQSLDVRYELHTLGWKAFQDLCATILREELGQSFRVFSPSRDGGQDGYFEGKWKRRVGITFTGSFTAQCKFTSDPTASLTLAHLSEELPKVAGLVKKGLSKTYILMTNCKLSGPVHDELRGELRQIGVKHFVGFGYESICQLIRESSRLRMLVPRIYGLGDLSQILDERAYEQAQEILFSMANDLKKFIITDAYTKSAKALQAYGFVLLLGEPGSGKSAIAQALSLAAIDRWKCRALKIDDPTQIRMHWNPHEPRQFFWIDDAFGATQYQRSLADTWNKTFALVDAAINKEARFILTSRDYIFKAATEDLKDASFPLIRESKVIIEVERLSRAEKQQILYNHLKLGNQGRYFRSEIKDHLPKLADLPHFLPEIARRLGNNVFTRNLDTSESGLLDFATNPREYLLGVIRNLTSDHRAALALIFMNGGNLPSPIDLKANDKEALQLLGGSESAIVKSLWTLEGSLVKLRRLEGESFWTYKHPTIRDAFADLVAQQADLLDIYLEGTPVERQLEEVTCGDVGLEGVKVIIPTSRYLRISRKLKTLSRRYRYKQLWFYANRCAKDFLEEYVASDPKILDELGRPGSYLSAVGGPELLGRLHALNLLPESARLAFVTTVERLAVAIPDADFLSSKRIRAVFRKSEMRRILSKVKKEMLPALEEEIDDAESFPDEEFVERIYPLSDALRTYRKVLRDRTAKKRISLMLSRLTSIENDLRREEDFPDEDDYGDDPVPSREAEKEEPGEIRSIFSDVDE